MTAPTKAMVLAAGLGTRLRLLTNDRPKALVELNGRTLLEITLLRLRSAGITDVIVNVHHFSEMIVDYLKQHQNFGMRIEISREEEQPLETGGGLKKAAWFFLAKTTSEEKSPAAANQTPVMTESFVGHGFSRDIKAPSVEGASAPDSPGKGYQGLPSFILHNVDVISNVDLRQMAEFHAEQNALATLMVQNRKASRYLLFDQQGTLCGRRFTDGQPDAIARPAPHLEALAFGGIHIISPRLLPLISEEGLFSIITTYLRLAAQGEKIAAYRADEAYWRDLGRPADLERAAQELEAAAGKSSS